MILATFKGSPPPLTGRVRGITTATLIPGPSPVAVLADAMKRFTIEKEGFLFVSPGAVVHTARIWPVVYRTDFDVAAHVDRIGDAPRKPGRFDGIGRVSTDTLYFRPTDGARRVLDRWAERNAVAPGRESINLAIALHELPGVTFLRLPSTWVWREGVMRSLEPNAEPVVRIDASEDRRLPLVVAKISDLSSARKAEPVKISPGVLWVGHLYQYTGYGKANREILLRLANSMSVRIDDSHREPVYVKEDLRARLDVHKNVLVGPRAPLLRMMGPDHISDSRRHRIVWTMQETSVRVHEDMVKRANDNFDEIWTPSSWNLEVFRSSGVRLPGRVMPLGVDPVVYRPQARLPLPLCRLISTSRRGLIASPDGFVFLTVGLPGFRKGWDVIADAAELAFSRRRNVHVVIALTHSPPGWNEKVYRQFAKYRVPIWTLEGSFDEHEMSRIYSSSNAYVSASRGEGFGLPCAEAAACCIPVIAPDNTCHTEIFGPEGFLFKTDGVKVYPEGDWISNWYKGQLFSRFGKRSIRELADIMETVRSGGTTVYKRAKTLHDKIVSRYTWDIAAARAATRLLEVQ